MARIIFVERRGSILPRSKSADIATVNHDHHYTQSSQRSVTDNESSGPEEEAPHDCCIGHSPDAPVPSIEGEFEQLLNQPLCHLVPLSLEVPHDDISAAHATPSAPLEQLLCRSPAIPSFEEELDDVLSEDDFSTPSNALEEPWYDAWNEDEEEMRAHLMPVPLPPITEGYGAEFVYDDQVVQLREEIVESSRRTRRRTLSEMSYDETGNWKKYNDEFSSEDELDDAQDAERPTNYDADEEDAVDETENKRSSGGKRRPPGAPEYEDESVVKRRRMGLDK